ncbi:MAG: DUF5011 domain-containing protein [Oscillospiraceae bacterium]|nr:DUF5011 domain-containing protein [Oscillospiraceae bacterium]
MAGGGRSRRKNSDNRSKQERLHDSMNYTRPSGTKLYTHETTDERKAATIDAKAQRAVRINARKAAYAQRASKASVRRAINANNRKKRVLTKKAKVQRVLLLSGILSCIALLVFGVVFFVQYSSPVPVTHTVTVGVGKELPAASTWFTALHGGARFRNADIDTDVIGDYKVTIRAGWRDYIFSFRVIDDLPPVAVPVSVSVIAGNTPSPDDFYKDLSDHSAVTAEFDASATKPDFSEPGMYDVAVRLTDEHGNFSIINTVCEVFAVDDEVFFIRGGDKPFEVKAFTSFADTDDCHFVKSPPEGFDKELGEYGVILSINGEEYKSKAVVIENTPPQIVVKNHLIFVGEKAKSGDFFTADDAIIKKLSSAFVETPDWALMGEQTVTVRVTDKIGNYINITPVLNIVKDTVPPVIHGATDVYATIGATVKYRTGITVTDDYDPEPKLSIDSSGVNISLAGEYQVTYTATDRSGNSSQVTVKVVVSPITQTILDDIANQRLRQMGVFDIYDPLERVKLIHAYVLNNVKFVRNLAYPDNDIVMLYTGLMSMQGDCIISQRMSELFFNIIGIESKRIINIWDKHEWNLIKINGLWYHYDATQYYDGVTDTFCFTNARAFELNDTVARFDRYLYHAELYPEVQ